MLIGIIHIVIFAKNDKNKIGFNSIYARTKRKFVAINRAKH